MPFGHWANFAACKEDVERRQGYTSEQSDKVCGKLKSKFEKSDANPHPGRGKKFLFAGYTHQQEKDLKVAREADRKKIDKDVQTKEQVHPRLNIYWNPKDKSRRGEGRVFDFHGMPLAKKATDWKMFISKPDLEKIPDKIKSQNQGMPTRWNLQTMRMKPPIQKDCKRCEQLKEGVKVEAEHADTLRSLGIPEDKLKQAQLMIATDHVNEISDYYERLEEMEVKKGDIRQTDPKDPDQEKEIRNFRLKSKLSPKMENLKEVQEMHKDDDVKKAWALDLAAMLASDRTIGGTFHKPVIDKENDIIPAAAMDKAMDDFMILPTLQEVHTERTVGIITNTWKTGDDEYKFEGKIKPGDDCDDVWKKIKDGIYDGLSIGGRRVKYSDNCAVPSSIRTTPCVTHKLKLYNVSVCSSPVNPEATMDEVNKVAKGEGMTETFIKAESVDSKVIHEE